MGDDAKRTLGEVLQELNKRGSAVRTLLKEADTLAAGEGKKVWLGVDGWYADLPENERQ